LKNEIDFYSQKKQKIMTTEKKLGIWMDHASAHLMEYADPIVTKVVTSNSTHAEKEKTLQKSESMMHNKDQQQESEYYKELGESIKNYDEVLLFGPTKAKDELLNILKKDPGFSKIKIDIKQTDQMTENQEHAFVSDYFSK
jgi:nitrogenase subunit NifH